MDRGAPPDRSFKAKLPQGTTPSRCTVRRMLSLQRKWASKLKRYILVAYFAAHDRRTAWLVRALALMVAAYALSPIDLIPDFIPVLGYLDDLVIVPLGLALVLRMIPDEVKFSALRQAATSDRRPAIRAMVVAIVAIWLLAAGALGVFAWQWLRT